MRRSAALLRGKKGYSWYNNFIENGKDGFKKNIPPTPFDWSAPSPLRPDEPISRTKVFFGVRIDKTFEGNLVFELADDVVPKNVENFKRLCRGQGTKFPGYAGTNIHLLRKGEVAMGGDVEGKNGRGNHSSYDTRYIPDENFIIPHSHRGMIR